MADTETLPTPTPISVGLRRLDDLIPYALNSRTHSPEQIAQIAASITEFGWTNPILADAQGVVAGHGRIMAARLILESGGTIKTPSGEAIEDGLVPVIDCAGWTEAKRKAYVIADNQLALNAGWNFDVLKVELEALGEMGFNFDVLGFTTGEMDIILNGWEPDKTKLESAGAHLDGIKATVKVMVEQADEPRALELIKAVLAENGIAFEVLA